MYREDAVQNVVWLEEWFQCKSLRTEFTAFVFQFLKSWVLHVKNIHSNSFGFFLEKMEQRLLPFLEQQILQQQRCLLFKIATVPTQNIIFKVNFQPQPCLSENTGWWKSPSSLLKVCWTAFFFSLLCFWRNKPRWATWKCIPWKAALCIELRHPE